MAREILSTYDIAASLSPMLTNFSGFTGSNRSGMINAGSNFQLSFMLWNQMFGYNSAVSFVTNNDIMVKKARIITPLAPGLRTGAFGQSRITVQMVDGDGYLNGINVFDFPKFNEWVDVNHVIKPYKNTVLNPGRVFCNMETLSGGTYLSVDDFNIQSDYIGETFDAYLEMVVDTSGMRLDYTGDII